MFLWTDKNEVVASGKKISAIYINDVKFVILRSHLPYESMVI
jgi:hypothetical protein